MKNLEIVKNWKSLKNLKIFEFLICTFLKMVRVKWTEIWERLSRSTKIKVKLLWKCVHRHKHRLLLSEKQNIAGELFVFFVLDEPNTQAF